MFDKKTTKPSDMETLLSNSESLMDGEKNISKNLNVTITVEGNTCTPSCQFFADNDLPGPLCTLFKEDLESIHGSAENLRCEQCLKTFGKDGDLKASVKTNKGSLLSKSEYDPEEDMEWTDEDGEDDSEGTEWEEGELESEAGSVVIQAILELIDDQIEVLGYRFDEWMEEKKEEGYTNEDEMHDAIEWAYTRTRQAIENLPIQD